MTPENSMPPKTPAEAKDGEAVRCSALLDRFADRELLDELLRRAYALTSANPQWVKHGLLLNKLYDCGKIIAEWDGRNKSK